MSRLTRWLRDRRISLASQREGCRATPVGTPIRTTTNDTFCILPWMHLTVLPDGTSRICCVASDGPLSLQKSTLAEIWNSEHMRKLRRDLVAGRPVQECSVCYRDEQEGGISHRHMVNRTWLERLGPL